MVLGIFLESIASDQNNEPKKFVWLSTSLHLITEGLIPRSLLRLRKMFVLNDTPLLAAG